MSTAAVVVIVVCAIVFVFAVTTLVRMSVRRRHLRERFGPEYDRMVSDTDDPRQAERDLAQREKRHRELDLRRLDRPTRERYARKWAAVQERFVDGPEGALTDASVLVTALMSERGYPTEDYDQQLVDLSVEHARVLDRYRAAHEISDRAGSGHASTEDIRQAMVHYRALFEHLLDMSTRHGSSDARDLPDRRV